MKALACCLVVIMLSGCSVFGENTLEEVVAKNGTQLSETRETFEKLKKHADLGESYYSQGDMDLAEAEFKAILDLKKEDEYALYRLGTIAFKKRNFDQSADYFVRVINQNPRNEKAQYNLASIRLMQAENHFKYYAALVGRETDIRKVEILLGDIDQFTRRDTASGDVSSLDQLAGSIKNNAAK